MSGQMEWYGEELIIFLQLKLIDYKLYIVSWLEKYAKLEEWHAKMTPKD